jgi:hypothetical protein
MLPPVPVRPALGALRLFIIPARQATAIIMRVWPPGIFTGRPSPPLRAGGIVYPVSRMMTRQFLFSILVILVVHPTVIENLARVAKVVISRHIINMVLLLP